MKGIGARGLLLLAYAWALLMPGPAQAQFEGGSGFTSPPQQFAPAAGPSVAPSTVPGGAMTLHAPPPVVPPQSAAQVNLAVSARFARESQPISAGLVWRIFPARPDPSRPYAPVREDHSATPVFQLPPGDYVVHVSLGLASAVKQVSLHSESMREIFDLPAGGIRMEGRVGDARIPSGQITFDVYPGSQFDVGDRKPIAEGVLTGEVVVVPEGTYYIVSNYGDSNAQVRSDIRVQVGKLTDVVVNHHAAVMVLKLVNERGGEALANTEWTVLTPGGDVIKESTGASPRWFWPKGNTARLPAMTGAPTSRPSRSRPASTARSKSWRSRVHAAFFSRRTSGGTASSTKLASAASADILVCLSLPRRRIETDRSAASFLPTTSSTGILASECSRTL